MSDDPLESHELRLPPGLDPAELEPGYGKLNTREARAVKALASQLLRRSLVTAISGRLPNNDAQPPVCIGALWIRGIKSLEAFYRQRVAVMANHASRAEVASVRIDIGDMVLNWDLRNPVTGPMVSSWNSFALSVATAVAQRMNPEEPLAVIQVLQSHRWTIEVYLRTPRAGKKDDWRYGKYDDPVGISLDDADMYLLRLAMVSSPELHDLVKELSKERKPKAAEVAEERIRKSPAHLKRLRDEAVARYKQRVMNARREQAKQAVRERNETERIRARDARESDDDD